MGKPSRPLATQDALKRAKKIVPLLAKDTWYALRARVSLHSANDVICLKDFSSADKFGDTYNVVQNSLVLTVALALARLFDVSNPDRYPIEQQDKASIPVLANLLMRQDVQEALADKAGAGLICRQAMSAALALYNGHVNAANQQEALSRLRTFRNSRLAHHLFADQLTDLPRIDDLDLLANCAREFIYLAVLAVEGIDRDLSQQEEVKLKIDTEFWDLGLSAIFSVKA